MRVPFSLADSDALEDADDVALWEAAEHEKNLNRLYKRDKHFVDPRVKKLRDFRHPPRSSHRSRLREIGKVKKATVRHFRRSLKLDIGNEVYYHCRNRDYRTYGWICW